MTEVVRKLALAPVDYPHSGLGLRWAWLCDTDAERPANCPDGSLALSLESGWSVRTGGAWTKHATLGADGKVPASQLPTGQPGSASWGGITGTLSAQSDLQAALNSKAASSHSHAIGDVSGLQGALDAKLNASDFQKLVQSSNAVTAANTTPINCPGLVFSFAANAVYVVDLFALTSAPAITTGSGFAFDTSVAVSINAMTFDHPLANTGTTSGGSSIADDTFTGVSSGRPTANVISLAKGSALIVSGANAGTAQLRYRSEVAAVSTCHSGSVIRVQRIA